jgi:hypothetical protein
MVDERRGGDEPRFDEIFANVRARRKPGSAAPAAKRRARWPLVVVVVALVAGGWVLARKLQQVSRIQDCVMSGRKNCDHIDDPGEH